jgi:hypothetical protein
MDFWKRGGNAPRVMNLTMKGGTLNLAAMRSRTAPVPHAIGLEGRLLTLSGQKTMENSEWVNPHPFGLLVALALLSYGPRPRMTLQHDGHTAPRLLGISRAPSGRNCETLRSWCVISSADMLPRSQNQHGIESRLRPVGNPQAVKFSGGWYKVESCVAFRAKSHGGQRVGESAPIWPPCCLVALLS